MAATIYTRTRELIGDSTATYTISDNLIYLYLDKALEKLSEIAGLIAVEDVEITTSDITNTYVSLTYDPIDFDSNPFGVKGVDWEFRGYNKIGFIRPTDWEAQTIYDVEYRRYFTRFKGATKEDSALDHPTEANLALCYYAVAEYLTGQGIMSADGSLGIITNKSEEGVSVSYSLNPEITSYGSPNRLKARAIELMRELPNAQANIWSVKI